MQWSSEMNYSLSEIAGLDAENLIGKSKAMAEDYQKNNEPGPEDVKGKPLWLNIHGERRYCLHYQSKNRKNGPVVFDIHGGGYVWGTPAGDDGFCLYLNEVLDIEVYSLEYPRTAEHPFPEALNELFDTISYMSSHASEFNFSPSGIALCGHSAGGNLVTAITLMNKMKKAFEIQCQILAYPVVTQELNVTDEDIAEDGLGLSRELMAFFARVYAPEENTKKNVLCSPLLADEEELRGLPPAVIMTCGKDIIRFQGREYAGKLVRANVEVLMREFEDCAHAFEVFDGPYMKAGQDFLIQGIKFFLGI